ncbi:MAG: Uma2 family endonuclease [Candidatus Obscuribacterales bacterium]|nr:Uma2 family endonuclease [Candidatus Obscuribacterales bacterium]
MTNAHRLKTLTPHEFLAFEEFAKQRHEFVDGQLFAMTGGSVAHNVISLNIATSLKTQLKGTGCTIFIADMKVRIEDLNCFYYPDVFVECSAYDKKSVYTETPVAIFEVLSRSTASTDRREKLVAYRHLASVSHYVIVHQTKQRLEVYRKLADEWTIQELGCGDSLVLDFCPDRPIAIAVEDIYADIEFDEGPDLQIREDIEVYAW